MSKQPIVPDFDDQFWMEVNDRVERVRNLTREELGRAEQELLAVEVEVAGEVVPVFPAPFWARVDKRAAKVRRMALDELADAEERLMNQPPEAGAASRSRPAILRGLPQLRPISPRARVNALGFVTAVLAVLMLLPQVMPISSFAGVRPRGPLGIFFSADDPEAEAPGAESGNPGAGSNGTRVKNDENEPASRSGTSAGTSRTAPKAAGTNPSTVAEYGNPGPSGSGGGAAGGNGGPGALAEGAAGTSSPGAVNAGPPPAAPSNLLVTAVDDNSVRLRWKDNSADETAFLIERKGSPVSRESVAADTKTYVWQGLPANSEACFRVRARNDGASSDWLPDEYECVTTHAALSSPGAVNLVPLACANEGSMSAGVKRQEAKITFRNQTPQTVNLYALGAEGVRELTPTALAPQGSTTVNTFLGHPYVVTGTGETAGCLAIFEATSWNTVATITDPAA
ncbi:MAG TPA: hypothetical protein VHL54_10270 [Actinomycetota bacterium]|nr:hypothetical protein [Actinomycetota bacterium]